MTQTQTLVAVMQTTTATNKYRAITNIVSWRLEQDAVQSVEFSSWLSKILIRCLQCNASRAVRYRVFPLGSWLTMWQKEYDRVARSGRDLRMSVSKVFECLLADTFWQKKSERAVHSRLAWRLGDSTKRSNYANFNNRITPISLSKSLGERS